MHQFLGGAFLFALDTSSYTTTQFFSYTMATQQKLATRWIHGYTMRNPTISAPYTMSMKKFSTILGPAVNPYVGWADCRQVCCFDGFWISARLTWILY